MSKDYFRNYTLWWKGWKRLGELKYKKRWGPRSFMIPYGTTYLAGVVAGYGVVSLSRAWYERSDRMYYAFRKKDSVTHAKQLSCEGANCYRAYPFAHFMTRLLNWLVPGEHGEETGGWLWESKCLRRM